MGLAVFCPVRELPRLRFSPVGESLSFTWPEESDQRKSHPWCVGLRLPCDARRPRRGWNSPWQGTQNVPCCGAQTPSPSFPRPAALLGDTQGTFLRRPVLGHDGSVHADGRFLSPSALPIWRVRAGKKRNRVRAPQHGAFCTPCQGELVERPPARAKSGTRRAAMWGRLSLVTFFGEAKKVTRPKAKREAAAYPENVHPEKAT
jgi:hypothetical protein